MMNGIVSFVMATTTYNEKLPDEDGQKLSEQEPKSRWQHLVKQMSKRKKDSKKAKRSRSNEIPNIIANIIANDPKQDPLTIAIEESATKIRPKVQVERQRSKPKVSFGVDEKIDESENESFARQIMDRSSVVSVPDVMEFRASTPTHESGPNQQVRSRFSYYG